MLGLLIAAVLCSLGDVHLLAAPLRRTGGALDKAELVRLVAYAWPLVAVAATGTILQTSDRFMLGSIAGADALGIFAVAYSLVDRPTTLICSSISTATFPLVVNVLETQGKEAARHPGRPQRHRAAGGDFAGMRGSGADLRPYRRVAGRAGLPCRCRRTPADHVLHRAGPRPARPFHRPRLPSVGAAVDDAVDLRPGDDSEHRAQFLCRAALRHVRCRLDRLGCQWLTVVAGWFIGTSLFPVWLPLWQTIRCVLAVVPMIAVLTLIRFPLNW